MNSKLRIYFLLYLLLMGLFQAQVLVAQKPTVSASIDSVQLWIGQQTRLVFELTQQPGEWIQSPIFSETIIDGIELVEPVKNDTSQSADGHMVVRQSYLLTSFTDSLFLIPSFPFVLADEDTIWSNPLSLKVIQPFIIDLEAAEIADIKGILTPRISLLYYLRKALPWLIGLLLLAAIVYSLYRLFKSKKTTELFPMEKLVPAHEIALGKLQQLREEKLWQSDRQKEYHTRMTDILREYIELTFGIPAPELTSDEVLALLSQLRKENKNAYLSLQQILQLADLVKFAKWHATPAENEQSMNFAFEFVNQTIKEEEEKNEDDIS
jgi:hypothetical protein